MRKGKKEEEKGEEKEECQTFNLLIHLVLLSSELRNDRVSLVVL